MFKNRGLEIDEPSNYDIKRKIESWQSLVHVCRRWRGLVFGSPRRLSLQLFYIPGTSAKLSLDIWLALPLLNFFFFFWNPLTCAELTALCSTSRIFYMWLYTLAFRREIMTTYALLLWPGSGHRCVSCGVEWWCGDACPPQRTWWNLEVRWGNLSRACKFVGRLVLASSYPIAWGEPLLIRGDVFKTSLVDVIAKLEHSDRISQIDLCCHTILQIEKIWTAITA